MVKTEAEAMHDGGYSKRFRLKFVMSFGRVPNINSGKSFDIQNPVSACPRCRVFYFPDHEKHPQAAILVVDLRSASQLVMALSGQATRRFPRATGRGKAPSLIIL
jgi:hypothetical protein